MKTRIWVLLALAAIPVFASADDSNELGLLLGAEFIPTRTTVTGNNVDIGNSIVFSADYARRLAGNNTMVFLEFPFAAAPSHHVNTLSASAITSLATLYVTPSVRVNFAHQARFSPWLSAGFGYGVYEGSSRFKDNTANNNRYTSTGTAQFGGGVDFRTGLKILLPIQLRGEVRDYFTVTNPNFGISVDGSGQHNIVIAGGIVLSF